MDPKVRDRTKKELLIRKKEFLKIADILDILKINYFISSGILLGAIRENNFIKWDWDIEFGIFFDEYIKKSDLIPTKLKKSGFKITKIVRNRNNLKINFIGKCPEDVTSYTIEAWKYSKVRDVIWRKEYYIPAKFFKKLSTVNFLGRKFNCPSNTKAFLTYTYGNWKKPLRTANKKVYCTDKFYRKKSLLYNYIESFLMKINGYFR